MMNPTSRSIRRTVLAASLALAVAPALAQTRLGALQTGDAAVPTALYDGLIVTYRAGTAERASTAAAASTLKSALAGTAARSQWNARFRQAPPTLNRVRRLGTGADLVRASNTLSSEQLNSLMQTLRADPSVAHVEPNLILRPTRDTVSRIMPLGSGSGSAAPRPSAVAGAPNDPGFSVQWHLRAPDGTVEHVETDPSIGQANRGGIDVLPAWQYGQGEGVVVAVIDTGITHHPDLDTSLADAGYDFISNALMSGRASDGRAPGGWDLGDWTSDAKYLAANGGCAQTWEQSDSSWHGTHVAGTIAMLTNNGLGMSGVAPKARILPVRALGHCGGSTADIADAITWASGGHVDGVPDNRNPAEIINMSLGGFGTCDSTSAAAQAIAGAISRGTLVVVAAGNDNSDAGSYTPASCPGVINVAATGITGKRAYYSNYGATITLSAPGGGVYTNDDPNTGTQARSGLVWSTLNYGTHEPAGPAYAGYSGTSMASPHVAGVSALILSAAYAAAKPLPSPQLVREILTQTSNVFPIKPTLRIGAGILDAAKASARAAGASGGGDEANATLLSKGQVLAGLTATQGATQLYRIDVPAGARNLQIRTLGGTGQVKMYVRATRAPSADGSDADVSSVRAGTTQNMQTALPASDSYFIRLVGGTGGYKNVSLTAIYTVY